MSATNTTRKLYQVVAQAISAAITGGQFLPGQKLPPERELAELHKVSRPTIREAMIALEIRGIVEAKQGSGVYVSAIAPNSSTEPDLDIGAFELTEARRLFEGEACALAAKTITDEEIASLYTLLTEMARESSQEIITDLADRDFHITIARATRNSAIIFVVENLWDLRYKAPLTQEILKRARRIGISPLVDDHRCIADALKKHDPAAARLAMQSHLTNVMDELFKATELEVLQKAKEELSQKRHELMIRSQL